MSKASLLQISHKPDGIMRKSCMQKWCRGEFDNSNLGFWGDGVIASHAGLTPSQAPFCAGPCVTLTQCLAGPEKDLTFLSTAHRSQTSISYSYLLLLLLQAFSKLELHFIACRLCGCQSQSTACIARARAPAVRGSIPSTKATKRPNARNSTRVGVAWRTGRAVGKFMAAGRQRNIRKKKLDDAEADDQGEGPRESVRCLAAHL